MHQAPVTQTTDGFSDRRKPWIAPVVQQIKAGEAEVGTRARSDGSFTTS